MTNIGNKEEEEEQQLEEKETKVETARWRQTMRVSRKLGNLKESKFESFRHGIVCAGKRGSLSDCVGRTTCLYSETHKNSTSLSLNYGTPHHTSFTTIFIYFSYLTKNSLD